MSTILTTSQQLQTEITYQLAENGTFEITPAKV
jgi:hypothetical protein